MTSSREKEDLEKQANRLNLIKVIFIAIFVAAGTLVSSQTGSALKIGETKFSYKSPKKYTIVETRFSGSHSYDDKRLLQMTGLTPGRLITVPGDDVSLAIDKLWKIGDFSDIQVSALKTIGSDIWLDIHLIEKQVKGSTSFVGDMTKSEQKDLIEAYNMPYGTKYSMNSILRLKRITRSYFVDKGYYRAKVDLIEKPDTLTGKPATRFIVKVDKGEKIKINSINISGNEQVKSSRLKRKMKKTKEKKWWRFWSRSKFLPGEFKNDKQNIVDLYRKESFRDAEITFDTVYNFDANTVNIDLKVNEEGKYYIRNITWVGNTKYRSTFLDTILGIERGDEYNSATLNSRLQMNPAGTDVASLYMDKGYLFFNVTPVEVSVENDSVDLEMRIYEGKQARVNRIIIKGNTRTSEHVIRREIKTKPGDLFNRNDAVRTNQLLSQLGYFNPETIGINPKPNQQDGTVDIEYSVEERPSDQIELSGGWGAGRVVGTVGVSFNNFSLRKFFKWDQWKPLPSGDGQRLSLRGQSNGLFFNSINFSFTEPWLGGKKPNSFSVSGWRSRQSLDGKPNSDATAQNIIIKGLSTGLGIRLKRPDEYFNLFGEISYQHYKLNNFGSIFTFANGVANNLSARVALTRSSIDQPIYPRQGSSFTLSYKFTPPYSLINGLTDESDFEGISDQERYRWLEYNKVKFSSSFFTSLSKNKKLVLNARMGLGFLQEWNKALGPSPFERFYLGGSGLTGFNLDGREIIALRGYDDNSISPQQGGLLISKYTLELRYPVSLNPNATIYGLAFTEAGNTWNDWKKYNPFSVKRSAGVGVRIFLPMFGLMGLDYAWGFDALDPGAQGYGTPLETLRKGQFHFTIGMNIGEL